MIFCYYLRFSLLFSILAFMSVLRDCRLSYSFRRLSSSHDPSCVSFIWFCISCCLLSRLSKDAESSAYSSSSLSFSAFFRSAPDRRRDKGRRLHARGIHYGSRRYSRGPARQTVSDAQAPETSCRGRLQQTCRHCRAQGFLRQAVLGIKSTFHQSFF